VRESVESSLAGIVVVAAAAAAAAADGPPTEASGDGGERGGGEEGDDSTIVARPPPLPSIDPEELHNSALVGHLVRLANEGKLGSIGKCAIRSDTAEDGSDDDSAGDANIAGGDSFGRISHRMTRDMDLGLDDPNDELALESADVGIDVDSRTTPRTSTTTRIVVDRRDIGNSRPRPRARRILPVVRRS